MLGAGGANHLGDGPLLTRGFEIDVEAHVGPRRVEFGERRDPDPRSPEREIVLGVEAIRGIDVCEVGQGVLDDLPRPVRHPVEGRVVEHDGNPVCGEANVDLEIVISESLDGTGERMHRVLGPQDPAPAVGESDRMLDGEVVAHTITPRLTTAATRPPSGRYGMCR